MTPEIQRYKDRARLKKAMQKNPDFVLQTLQKVYGNDGGEEGVFRNAHRFDIWREEGKFLDVAILSYLVGKKIICPQEKYSRKYILTAKGRKLFLQKENEPKLSTETNPDVTEPSPEEPNHALDAHHD